MQHNKLSLSLCLPLYLSLDLWMDFYYNNCCNCYAFINFYFIYFLFTVHQRFTTLKCENVFFAQHWSILMLLCVSWLTQRSIWIMWCEDVFSLLNSSLFTRQNWYFFYQLSLFSSFFLPKPSFLETVIFEMLTSTCNTVPAEMGSGHVLPLLCPFSIVLKIFPQKKKRKITGERFSYLLRKKPVCSLSSCFPQSSPSWSL